MSWAEWVTIVPPITPQHCCAWTGKPLFCLVYCSSWYCQPLLGCIQCNQLIEPFRSMHWTAHVKPLWAGGVSLRWKGNSNGVLLFCILTQCHTCAARWLEPWSGLCLSLDPIARFCTHVTELEVSRVCQHSVIVQHQVNVRFCSCFSFFVVLTMFCCLDGCWLYSPLLVWFLKYCTYF